MKLPLVMKNSQRHVWAIVLSLVLSSTAVKGEQPGWQAAIMIGTASPGGPYYVYGQVVARILSRELKVETDAQVTQGPAQNILLLEKPEAMPRLITSPARP